VRRRHLGEVGNFVVNLSKTLHINFYQNRSSTMTKNFGVCFYAQQCSSSSLDQDEALRWAAVRCDRFQTRV